MPACSNTMARLPSNVNGTGLGTAFHMLSTHPRGDVRAIAPMTKNTVLADWLFTSPAAIMPPVTGFLMVAMAAYDLLESRLMVTCAIHGIAGACRLKVVQLQLRMRTLANAAAEQGDPLSPAYRRAFRLWFVLGWPAFLGLVIVFALMVMKPDIW